MGDKENFAGEFRQPILLAHKPVKGFGVVVALCKGHKIQGTQMLGKRILVDTAAFNPWWITSGCTCENCKKRRQAV